MSDLETLLAKQALAELAFAYCRAVDRRDFELLATLYADGAVHDHGGMFCGDAAAFVDWLSASLPGMHTHHFVGNALYAIDGDRAEGEVYTVNYHVIERADQSIDYVAGGRYLDHYVRGDGGWKIQWRKRVIDWTRQGPSAAAPVAAGVAGGSPDRTDPSWGGLGLLATMRW